MSDNQDIPITERAIQVFSDLLVEEGRKRLQQNREERARFEEQVYGLWQEGLDFVEIICMAAIDAGAIFNEEKRPKAVEDNDARFEVLARLHSRACAVADEILTLMKAGHASGAYSRWRTLHELAVLSILFAQNEPELAQRYILHEQVESAKAAQAHLRFQDRLQLEHVEANEVNVVVEARDSVTQQLGGEFKTQYGWASELLGKPRPTFADLEKAAGLDHWRPYYMMASWGVHATSKGAMWNLGSGRLDKFLLAGGSVYGLADPGHQAVISLLQITSAFLLLDPTAKEILTIEGLTRLVDRAGEAFIQTHRRLEEPGEATGIDRPAEDLSVSEGTRDGEDESE